MKRNRPVRIIAIGLPAIVVLVSAADRSRPPIRPDAPLLAGANVPQEVRLTLERACRDCHSDATRYPWYSYVAPVSWLICSDVKRGRERLNFSKWNEYSPIRKQRCLSDIANQVQDGGMPLSIYTLLHRDAKLTKSDISAIFNWTQQERVRLILQSAGAQGRQ